MFSKKKINTFKRYYGEVKRTIRDMDVIRTFFDMKESNDYTLDDQTWEDLNMNKVFCKMDKSYSSLGEAILYDIMRNPVMDEKILKERSMLIDSLRENEDLRSRVQYIFFRLGFDRKNRFLEMMQKNFINNKVKGFIYTLFGLAQIVFILLTIIFKEKIYAVTVFILLLASIFIADKERKNVTVNGLIYLNDILKAAKRITRLNWGEMNYNREKITALLKELKPIIRKIRLISMVNMFGGFLEPLAVPFLVLEGSYYRIIGKINEKNQQLLDLYYYLGEIESYISIGSYKESLKGKYSEPKFIDEVKLSISDGAHPLLSNPVTNSIVVDKNGVVLTGTNMSGKSTFLRMLGINVLLAQTFYFTLSSKYESCFFNIVSSISPKDDIDEGKSYYLAEAEAILRIIKSLDKPIPVFTIIDEIFRGTNPIERISASAAILNYISNSKAITFVATHDKELTKLLEESYDFYYFSENIDKTEGLSFDYKLKHGLSKSRNAIKLLDYVGYPKDIIGEAVKYAKEIESVKK